MRGVEGNLGTDVMIFGEMVECTRYIFSNAVRDIGLFPIMLGD